MSVSRSENVKRRHGGINSQYQPTNWDWDRDRDRYWDFVDVRYRQLIPIEIETKNLFMLKINCQEKIDSHSFWFDLLKFDSSPKVQSWSGQCRKSRKTVKTGWDCQYLLGFWYRPPEIFDSWVILVSTCKFLSRFGLSLDSQKCWNLQA